MKQLQIDGVTIAELSDRQAEWLALLAKSRPGVFEVFAVRTLRPDMPILEPLASGSRAAHYRQDENYRVDISVRFVVTKEGVCDVF